MLGTIPHPRFGSLTEGLQALFLDHLTRTGQVRLAAAACGLSRQSVYKLRRRDPVFAQKWDDALEHLRTRRAAECAAISADFQRRARELAASKFSPRTV